LSLHELNQAFVHQSAAPNFDVKDFVNQHFEEPGAAGQVDQKDDVERNIDQHIEAMWDRLSRLPDPEATTSSLLPLKFPYIVPGGRFREIYYWDSYFTCEGLATAGRLQTIQGMVDNMAHLLDTYGHIPNGNRSYYLSRSQPPFFCHMVCLLASKSPDPDNVLARYGAAMEREYDWWMQGREKLHDDNTAICRVVSVGNGLVLNRYWDSSPTPRPESFRADTRLADSLGFEGQRREEFFTHIRAAAESGWDFSSRWFADRRTMHKINTTDIIPVDLNALLLFLEQTLAKLFSGSEKGAMYEQAAEQRRRAMDALLWDPVQKFYFDYDWKAQTRTPVWSLAAAYPLFVGGCSTEQAEEVIAHLQSKFLQAGGFVSTWNPEATASGQQWDWPNGWAPLQWVCIRAAQRYGHNDLAWEARQRWLQLNTRVFDETHKMMEKYDVVDTNKPGGGGEYNNQEGFGWTNGIYLALSQLTV